MNKVILLFFMLVYTAWAQSVVDCNKIFEERKSELLRLMDRLDEEEQSFEIYKDAQNALLEKKKQKLDEKLKEVNATLKKVQNTKRQIVELYDKNKKLLEEIKKAKDDKITGAYLKMKDSKAAAILDAMPRVRAAKILFNLTPKKISKVMAKMDPDIASEVTALLTKGPPFDLNRTK